MIIMANRQVQIKVTKGKEPFPRLGAAANAGGSGGYLTIME